MQTTQDTNTLHDFNDGNGPVPAHRHKNGGGWVADTAHVEDTVYVGPNARIFGYAHIKDESIITEKAEISGYAMVKDFACIKGQAVIRGSCTIKDHAEISGNVFIASHITIKGYTVFDKDQYSFKIEDCRECPALLDENYGSTHRTPCLYCLEKLNSRKTANGDSGRSTVRPWFPQGGGINQNIEAETRAPQKSGSNNP